MVEQELEGVLHEMRALAWKDPTDNGNGARTLDMTKALTTLKNERNWFQLGKLMFNNAEGREAAQRQAIQVWRKAMEMVY